MANTATQTTATEEMDEARTEAAHALADVLSDELVMVDEELTSLQDDLDILRARMQQAVEDANPTKYAEAASELADTADKLATVAVRAAYLNERIPELTVQAVMA